MVSAFVLKVLLSLAMFTLTVLSGMSAIKLRQRIAQKQQDETANKRQRRKTAWVMTLLSCFAGGVFMGTCFLDIFPHINEHYTRFRGKMDERQWELAFPFPQFFVCIGFFLVYLLEELILRVFATSEQRKQSLALAKISINGATPTHSRFTACTKPDCSISGGHSSGNTMTGLNLCPTCLDTLTHEAVIAKYLSSSKKVDLLKSVTFAFAISFHSVLEGLALGVQESTAGIATLFMSLIIHKGIEAFSVGLQLSKSNSRTMVVALICTYALMTPLGAIIGDLISNLPIDELLHEGIIIVLESLAGGTFIYVTFLEVLAQERAKEHSSLIQLSAIVLGFLVIVALQVFEKLTDFGHHGHEHGHEH